MFLKVSIINSMKNNRQIMLIKKLNIEKCPPQMMIKK